MLQNVVKGWNGHQTNMVKELKIRNGTFKKGKFDTFEHYEKRNDEKFNKPSHNT